MPGRRELPPYLSVGFRRVEAMRLEQLARTARASVHPGMSRQLKEAGVLIGARRCRRCLARVVRSTTGLALAGSHAAARRSTALIRGVRGRLGGGCLVDVIRRAADRSSIWRWRPAPASACQPGPSRWLSTLRAQPHRKLFATAGANFDSGRPALWQSAAKAASTVGANQIVAIGSHGPARFHRFWVVNLNSLALSAGVIGLPLPVRSSVSRRFRQFWS